jgi:hypothetical protein
MNFDQTRMWQRLNDEAGNYYCESTEPEREEFRNWVKNLLQTEKVIVEFTKADGTTRVMNCTLNEEHGAKYVVQENKETAPDPNQPKKVNNDICKVWDIDQTAWRSFRWDRLKRIEFKIG